MECPSPNETEVTDLHLMVGDLSDTTSDIVRRLNSLIADKSKPSNSSTSASDKSPSCSRCFKAGTPEQIQKSKDFISTLFPQYERSLVPSTVYVDLSEFRIGPGELSDGPSDDDDESLQEGSFLETESEHQRVPHGVFRKVNEYGDVDFFGLFFRGNLVGRCWKSLPGGGMLASSQLDFSGADTAFLYPDIRTAMVGDFSSGGRMIEARLAEVSGIRKTRPSHGCNKACRLVCPLTPVFAIQNDKDVFRYDKSTGSRISSDPKLRDPYERHFVRIGKSRIPMAGQGLFAKNRIEPFTVVAFYNGVRSHEDDYVDEAVSDEEDDENCDVLGEKYRYRLKLSAKEQMDIPKEMATIEKYNATLAHKIQHSFTPNCEMDDFEHPRFGDIKCVASLKPIKAGEELTIHYAYELNTAPVWYKKQWARHQKRARGLPDWQTALVYRNSQVIPPGALTSFMGSSNASTSSSSSNGRLSRPVSQCFAILEELENDEYALNFADDEKGDDESASVASFF